MLLGEVFHVLFTEIDSAKNLCVLRFEALYDPVQAGADLVFELRGRLFRDFQLAGPRLKGFRLARLPPITVDDGIAKQAIEPGHGRFVLLKVVPVLKGAKICGLENIFGKPRIRNTALHKSEKLFSLGEKLIERSCIRHIDSMMEKSGRLSSHWV